MDRRGLPSPLRSGHTAHLMMTNPQQQGLAIYAKRFNRLLEALRMVQKAEKGSSKTKLEALRMVQKAEKDPQRHYKRKMWLNLLV